MANPSLASSAAGSTGSPPGHPRGLYTLFLTEMWERFSYYGRRALLVLFMVDSVRGGQGMSDAVATSIYGLYTASVYLGLIPVVLGTGMLKPNVSTIVGELYPEGGARRDAGFTIFYMGINLGAAIGPLVASTLGEKLNWHYGFGAAGVGMVLGLIQFRLSALHLGECGRLTVAVESQGQFSPA